MEAKNRGVYLYVHHTTHTHTPLKPAKLGGVLACSPCPDPMEAIARVGLFGRRRENSTKFLAES
jgi:hypothetical protein